MELEQQNINKCFITAYFQLFNNMEHLLTSYSESLAMNTFKHNPPPDSNQLVTVFQVNPMSTNITLYPLCKNQDITFSDCFRGKLLTNATLLVFSGF